VNIVYEEKYISGEVDGAKYWGILHAALMRRDLAIHVKFKPLGKRHLVKIPLTEIRQVEISRGRIADDINICFQEQGKERVFRLRSRHPSNWIDVLEKLNVNIIGKPERFGQGNKLALIATQLFFLLWIILLSFLIIGAVFTILWRKY